MTIELYEYQKRVIECCKIDPNHSQLISMPTGTGKTITFLNLAKECCKKTLIIVHREELLNQTYEKAKLCGFKEEDISVVCANSKPDLKLLNIAMVQTLARNLEKYDSSLIELMIVDEAHHATASSYRKIFDHFRIFEEKKMIVGFTATPLRGDSQLLSSIFHSHSFKMTLSEATQNGYICPVSGLRIEIDKALDKIETTQGDYDINQLDKVMNCDQINDLIAERCEHLTKTPAIVFCTSVDHAKQIAKKIREKKRKAISVSYLTPKSTLNRIFSMLKQGRVEFITNAIKLSEGFDHPPIQTVVMARPTRSPVLYKQMIGRGLRNHKDKEDCFVLEFGGNDEKMIKWEDIDNNCTFQSITAQQKKSREEALNFYTNRFASPNIKILDVRISPFNFYECYIRRVVRYKKTYLYSPFTTGVILATLHPVIDKGFGGHFYHVYGGLFIYKDKYKSVYPYGGVQGYGYLLYLEWGMTLEECEKTIEIYSSKMNVGSWYPSEEQPITRFQKKFIKENMSARKAEMMIEDKFCKKLLDKYLVGKRHFNDDSILWVE